MIDASAAMMANSSQFLQSNDPASCFHLMDYNSVTPAPIVKSQGAVASGDYFTPLQQQQQQQPTMNHFMYQQPNYHDHPPSIYQQPPQQPIIESSNMVNAFQNPMHSNMMIPTNMYPPPSFVSTTTAPISPPYTYDQVGYRTKGTY